ncbi:hypothetical protein [Propionivibrio dicarboxylicus]|uniref:DUF5666 domain-containing protein n=1 Tax=Propionivibrio dicarboxylicus TaxID=83767 RepID=A0A1G8AFW5_9RHOO|nr:hypothetical protein [Propionivibrio dicarboxylicus]SDH19746.1 hypothetical protein SAMN05660652_01371 [Propionivibrio dicarboxylicus]
MRSLLLNALCATVFAFSATTALAADVKMVGVVEKIQLAPDGKSAKATLKDNKSGNSVVLSIGDDETLDKFKDKRIQVGDEIRARFDDAGGNNQSKSFRKTAGC